MIEVLQTSALPLGYAARILTLYKLEINLSGRRDSNPRPPHWQGDILQLKYFRKMMAGLLGVEPSIAGPKTAALTIGYNPTLYKDDRWNSNPRMPEPQSRNINDAHR